MGRVQILLECCRHLLWGQHTLNLQEALVKCEVSVEVHDLHIEFSTPAKSSLTLTQSESKQINGNNS